MKTTAFILSCVYFYKIRNKNKHINKSGYTKIEVGDHL